MTVTELIAAAKASEVSEADVEALRQYVSEAELRYEKQAEKRAVDGDTLGRTYSL